MEQRPPAGTAIATTVLDECAALGLAPKQVYPGIIVTNGGFAKKVLGIDPSTFIQSLDARVPVVGVQDTIDPGLMVVSRRELDLVVSSVSCVNHL